MENGQPCYIDYEGQRRLEFERLVRKANQVANDDVLFEKEKIKVSNFEPSSREFISYLDQHYGDIFYMAASIRRDKQFFKEHGRTETIFEFLTSTFSDVKTRHNN
jgi:hypothetical protein